jgi:hypothetical protein
VVELEEEMPVAVHEQHVAVAGDVRVAGVAPLDPARLRLGRLGDRIAGGPAGCAGVALVAELHEGDRHQRLGAGDAHVDHPVGLGDDIGVAAEIGVEWRVAPDEVDEVPAVRIEGRLADVHVPPVVGREQREGSRQRPARLGRKRGGAQQEPQGEGESALGIHG